MKKGLLVFWGCLLAVALGAQELPPEPAQEIPQLSHYTLGLQSGKATVLSQGAEGLFQVEIAGETHALAFVQGMAPLPFEADAAGRLLLIHPPQGKLQLYHLSVHQHGGHRLRHIPLWLSIVPPLVAILLSLIFKEVISSLFIGVWSGAFIAGGLRLDAPYYFLLSFWDVVQRFVITALNDEGHLSIIVFSMLIGGMVALISRNGGMAGIILAVGRLARSARSAQFTTWLLGVLIFFDDYANTLIVGNTMRSATDRFRISREKLSYIVDSTAAPIAAIAFITTWIGAQLGYIESGIKGLEGFESNMTPYAIFLNALPYNFYAFFTLLFMLMVIYMRRDFGPMYRAEARARSTGRLLERPVAAGLGHETEALQPVEGVPLRWYNAFVPVILVILATGFGLLDTGLQACHSELTDKGIAPTSQSWATVWGALGQLIEAENPNLVLKLGKVIGSANSYVALLWASLTGVTAALLLTLGGRIMRITESMATIISGFKTMLPALIILTLAWSLAAVTEQLHTATFLTTALKDSLHPYLLPALIFVLAAGISFSTGSSWSTMAILYPIAIPMAWAVTRSAGMDAGAANALLFNSVAVVLSASVLGDHCSPISDTTILSSLASDCPHIDHVRTQLPYALLTGVVSMLAGIGAAALGGGLGVCLLMLALGTGILMLVLWRVGKEVPTAK